MTPNGIAVVLGPRILAVVPDYGDHGHAVRVARTIAGVLAPAPHRPMLKPCFVDVQDMGRPLETGSPGKVKP